MTTTAVYCKDNHYQATSELLASKLHLPLITTQDDQFSFLLIYDNGRLTLQQNGKNAPGPIFVDFVEGTLAHRTQHPQKELLAKAVGITSTHKPTIIDATAGLGRDAFILASLGATVIMIEQSPIISALLRDGLTRAEKEPALSEIINRLTLIEANSIEYLKTLKEKPDVIYIDPMFPERKKSALVKKEMQILQKLLPPATQNETLFELALKKAKKRIIVKRPRLAPTITNQKPNFQITGKNSRFDVYTGL